MWNLRALLGKLSKASETCKAEGVLVTLPGEEYNILDCSGAGLVSFFGFLDLSSLRAGDVIDVVLKMALNEVMVNRRITYKGPVTEPIVDFPRKEAINPVISIKQTAGLSRKIWFTFKWTKI